MNKIIFDKKSKKLIVLDIENNVYYKDNPKYFKELIDFLETFPISFAVKIKSAKSGYKYLKDWIDSKIPILTRWDYSIATKINWVLTGRTDFPICANHNCANFGKQFGIRRNVKYFEGYPNHCSLKCIHTDHAVHEKAILTCLEKYGVTNYTKTEEYLEKTKATKLEKYGDEKYVNLKKIKETKLERYGDENYSNSDAAVKTKLERYGKIGGINEEKRERTCMEKYGVQHYSQTDEFKEKCRKASLSEYGVESPFQSETVKEKIRTTNIEHLGVEYPMQSEEIQDKSKASKLERYGDCNYTNAEQRAITNIERYGTENVFASEYGKNKIHETIKEKYGVEHISQSIQFKDSYRNTCIERYGVEHGSKCRDIRLKQQKRYVYDNRSFDSAPELAFYIWLTDNRIKFEYQPDCDIWYEYEGKKHRYFPDFKVGEAFYEIKGDQFLNEDGTWKCPYDRSKDSQYEAKRQCCLRNNIIILYSKDYKLYLDYIYNIYGKDYLKQFKKENTEK